MMNKLFIAVSMSLMIMVAVSVLWSLAYQLHPNSEEIVIGPEKLESLIQDQRESFQATFFGDSDA